MNNYQNGLNKLVKLVKAGKSFTSGNYSALTKLETAVSKKEITDDLDVRTIAAIRQRVGYGKTGGTVQTVMSYNYLKAQYADNGKEWQARSVQSRAGVKAAAVRYGDKMKDEGNAAEADKVFNLLAKIEADQEKIMAKMRIAERAFLFEAVEAEAVEAEAN